MGGGGSWRHVNDLESGGAGSGGFEDYESPSDPFDIDSTKSASVDRLKRWRAPLLFQASGQQPNGTEKTPPSPIPTGNYSISHDQLASMTRDHDFSALQNYGGVKGLSEKLKTNPDKGIHDDESNILERKTVFGSNTYPRKKGRSFWRCVLDACQDTTLIILMVPAAASLALGIKTEGIKEGWYDGGGIALAVIVFIVVTATIDYKQSLQFQNLNEEKQDIHLEVVRGGRSIEISIFDIVVGDVIKLKIGDQVPADGILIFGHSLAIDESSMTGESIVHKDQEAPFLMSGCKVADGYGSMLVTSVGINTKWGLLMASISEDNGEETPLQMATNVNNTNKLSLRYIPEKDKLTGLNFLSWEHNLRVKLTNEGKWYVLEKPLGEVPSETAITSVRDAYNRHHSDELYVRRRMLAMMNSELQTIMSDGHAYDMIRKLRDMFQVKSCTERYNATKALISCKMTKKTSVSAHILKIKDHLDYLEKLGYSLPLQLATDIVVSSLSDDYRSFVDNYHMNNMERSITELCSMLESVELNMERSRNIQAVDSDKEIRGRNGKGKGKIEPDQIAPRSNGDGKNKGKKVKSNKARSENRCFGCGEIGHWKTDCPKRRKEGGKAGTSGG